MLSTILWQLWLPHSSLPASLKAQRKFLQQLASYERQRQQQQQRIAPSLTIHSRHRPSHTVTSLPGDSSSSNSDKQTSLSAAEHLVDGILRSASAASASYDFQLASATLSALADVADASWSGTGSTSDVAMANMVEKGSPLPEGFTSDCSSNRSGTRNARSPSSTPEANRLSSLAGAATSDTWDSSCSSSSMWQLGGESIAAAVHCLHDSVTSRA